MSNTFPDICRYFSVLDRLMKMYYDRNLVDYDISYGQQFYLECVSEHPGITAHEMASFIRVDKATLTKNINKLIELGFVTSVNSEQDRRSKHLYPTEKSAATVKKIKEIHAEFYDVLCSEISQQDIHIVTQILSHMADNINKKVWHRMNVPEHRTTQSTTSGGIFNGQDGTF